MSCDNAFTSRTLQTLVDNDLARTTHSTGTGSGAVVLTVAVAAAPVPATVARAPRLNEIYEECRYGTRDSVDTLFSCFPDVHERTRTISRNQHALHIHSHTYKRTVADSDV